MFGGVALYTINDIHFTVAGYIWLAVWYSFAVFEMVYVKKVVDTVEMTTWSRTYYQVRPIRQAPTCRIQPACFESAAGIDTRPDAHAELLKLLFAQAVATLPYLAMCSLH